MICAVRQGTVLFSTIIAPGFAARAMSLVAPSKADMFVACPAPTPVVLVGVLTLRRMRSASVIAFAISVEKNRLGPRAEMFDGDPSVAPGCMVVARKPSRALRTTS
jgi:hypothetical protein